MSRLGTCRHAYQIQDMWRVPLSHHPHEAAEQHRALPEGKYTCQWLDTAGDLPPPIRRMHGGFALRERNCDGCARHAPAAPDWIKRIGAKPPGEWDDWM